MSPGGLEGVADVDPYGMQWQVWRRPVPARFTAPESAWRGVVRAGAAAMPLTVVGMAPRRPNVTT
jgi:hypothetical protein